MENLKLHETINFYRRKQNLTQEALAQRLGVTNQSVSKWESAQCYPDISLLPQLAEIFEISIDELFGRDPLVNDIYTQFPLRDDDTFRVVVAQGNRILSAEDMNALNHNKVIDIRFPKNCNETTRQYFNVEVYGNICCDASINGDVIGHGRIECNQINGDIKKCDENISCGGSINGDVQCGNNISCAGDINGDVSCRDNVACGDNITGNVTCGGSVECEKIEGDVQCQGNIIYK